ncbi:MAG: chitooligosaccharide deacetylase, partial [Hymenobacter sp.]
MQAFWKSCRPVLLAGLGLAPLAAPAQAGGAWHGKSCAVVLTYDDAIDVDLDHALPALDSAGLRGTFYLIAAAPVVQRRLPEWRAAARRGHELGNHSLFHPCDGRPTGRGFVTPDNDLSTYTLGRATQEIRAANTLLQAIDGQTRRTFAYPCGDLVIGDSLFYRR